MADELTDPGTTLELAIQRRAGDFNLNAELVCTPGITALFGESGSGKSMTLRCIAGLARPDSGRVMLGGQLLFDSESGIDVPAHRRGIGIVLQHHSLFPHMSVAGNIEFGLQGIPKQVRRDRVQHLLRLLNLPGFEDRKPGTLSGGQQQRVALARALAQENRLLLLDEPFSALDDSLRQDLREELLRLTTNMQLTVLFITHDLREAHLLADRIAVIGEGQVLQFGATRDIFKRPASRRVGELTGVTNIWRGTVMGVNGHVMMLETSGMELRVPLAQGRFEPGSAVDILVRAERINLRRDHATGTNIIRAAIVEEFAYGATHTLRLQPDGPGPVLEIEIAARPYEVLGVAGRKSWSVELPVEDIHVVPAI